MPRLSLLVAVSAIAAASLSSVSQAHNYVLKPLAEFKAGSSGMGNWVAEFSPPWKGDFSTGAKYTAIAKQQGVTSVRSFLESKGPDCGNTNPNAKAKAIPSDGQVMLYRSMDHPGPCELWLDNTMVYHNDDCQAAYGGATPGFKVDFSSCKGSCTLRFYWLGLQDKGQRMQSYKNCIPLTGGGGARSTNTNTNTNNANTNKNTNTNTNKNTNKNGNFRSMDEYSFADLNE